MAPSTANRKQRPGRMPVVHQGSRVTSLIGGREPVFLRTAGSFIANEAESLRVTFSRGEV